MVTILSLRHYLACPDNPLKTEGYVVDLDYSIKSGNDYKGYRVMTFLSLRHAPTCSEHLLST